MVIASVPGPSMSGISLVVYPVTGTVTTNDDGRPSSLIDTMLVRVATGTYKLEYTEIRNRFVEIQAKATRPFLF
jgi:hypothetical protein